MPNRTTLALCLSLAALIAGCGGDDEDEQAATTDTTPTQVAAPPPETTATETTGTETGSADDDAPTVSRADARGAGRAPAHQASEEVPNSDLYFLDTDDVTCESPDADQPDNLNERASEWTCTIDSETNGVHCEGTYSVVTVGGEDRFSGDPEVTDSDITCEPA